MTDKELQRKNAELITIASYCPFELRYGIFKYALTWRHSNHEEDVKYKKYWFDYCRWHRYYHDCNSFVNMAWNLMSEIEQKLREQ